MPMDDFNLFFMCGNDYRGCGDIDCYFDHPQPALWEDGNRENLFWSKFEKEGDSVECVLGIRLRGDRGTGFSEDNTYYIGFGPVMSDDEDKFNPAIDARCVALKDMPREQEA